MFGRAKRLKLTIAKPCEESWSTMHGNHSKRHCESCNRHVYNFSQMPLAQIERLIAETDGGLCARITRRNDGSLVTLDSSRPVPRAAAVVLAGSIAFGASAFAQTGHPTTRAMVSGRLLTRDGSKPAAGGIISFGQDGKRIASVTTDVNGDWTADLTPGNYDIYLRQNALFGTRVLNVTLHDGEQSFSPMRTRLYLGNIENSGETESPFMGEISSTIRYPASYLFKHPIRYIKSLRQNH